MGFLFCFVYFERTVKGAFVARYSCFFTKQNRKRIKNKQVSVLDAQSVIKLVFNIQICAKFGFFQNKSVEKCAKNL